MNEPVELLRCVHNARVVPSIKVIRAATGGSLAAAKEQVRTARSGVLVTLEVPGDRVDTLVQQLCALGWTVRARGEPHEGLPQPETWVDRYRCAEGTVLRQLSETDQLAIVVTLDAPINGHDQLVIPIDEDFAMTEVLSAVSPVPEGFEVRVSPPDAEAVAFLREHFTEGAEVTFVRGAPLPVRDAG